MVDPLPPGQAGIRFRDALLAGDLDRMRLYAAMLDEAHQIELILGAALRDGRDDFAAARAYARGEDILSKLVGEPDTTLDDEAGAWIAAGRIDDRWRRTGQPLDGPVETVDDVVAAWARGVDGLVLVDAFATHPLHAAVSGYYRRGSIHALGPRPLLVLVLARP